MIERILVDMNSKEKLQNNAIYNANNGAIISNAMIKPTLCCYVGKGRHNLREVWTTSLIMSKT